MIRSIGFLDTSTFTAMFIVKYAARMESGILPLRGVREEDDTASDLPILKEWKSGRALLSRIRTHAAPFFEGRTPELGSAFIETVPPNAATPWVADPAATDVRLRVCLVPAPEAYSHCGVASTVLNVGLVTVFDHRLLCSEVNHSLTARTHLVVDVIRPEL